MKEALRLTEELKVALQGGRVADAIRLSSILESLLSTYKVSC